MDSHQDQMNASQSAAVQPPELPRPLDREAVRAIYESRLPHLVFQAMSVARIHHDPCRVQMCTLANIKQGGCPEDCGYCSQSARHGGGAAAGPLAGIDDVVEQARAARDAGSTRFCMGAAWRAVREGSDFETVLEMIRRVGALGIETCVTLGMLTADQARRLKEAGLTSYNHNLDTSREFYPAVTTTHSFDDRLRTIALLNGAGIAVCSGGILGLGESREDRVGLLTELANLEPYPDSVPINALVPIGGTPMAGAPSVDAIEMARAIATARILMPRARIRLAAGRTAMTDEAQTLCFLAGANSIFTGERLLTTPNPGGDDDARLFSRLGLRPEAATG